MNDPIVESGSIIWKDLTDLGFPGYRVSTEGEIQSSLIEQVSGNMLPVSGGRCGLAR